MEHTPSPIPKVRGNDSPVDHNLYSSLGVNMTKETGNKSIKIPLKRSTIKEIKMN